MNVRVWLLGLICALSCVGCGLETRNRVVVFGEMDGVVDGHEVSFERDTRLLEGQALAGFGSVTLEQRGSEETVEVTVIFETGIDDLVEGAERADEAIDVIARTRADREAWRPSRQGRIVSADAYLTDVDEIDTIDVRGVHEHWDIHLLVDFAPATSPNALVEQTDEPPPEPELVEVQIHYDRDRVRDKPRERSSSSYYDDC